MSNQAKDSPTDGLVTLCGGGDDACAVCRGVAGVRLVASEDLLQGRREVFIVHKGQVYRLLHTRNDKLILQK